MLTVVHHQALARRPYHSSVVLTASVHRQTDRCSHVTNESLLDSQRCTPDPPYKYSQIRSTTKQDFIIIDRHMMNCHLRCIEKTDWSQLKRTHNIKVRKPKWQKWMNWWTNYSQKNRWRVFESTSLITEILFITLMSTLEYANSVWYPKRKTDVDKLEWVQKRATKLILELSNKPYRERLKILYLPTLKYRRYRGDMIELFKIIKGIYDSTCSSCRFHGIIKGFN